MTVSYHQIFASIHCQPVWSVPGFLWAKIEYFEDGVPEETQIELYRVSKAKFVIVSQQHFLICITHINFI